MCVLAKSNIKRIREAAPFLMSKNVEKFIKLVKAGKL